MLLSQVTQKLKCKGGEKRNRDNHDSSVSTLDVDPDLRLRLCHKTVTRLNKVVVVEGRLEAEVLQQGHDDRQRLELGKFVAWKKKQTD